MNNDKEFVKQTPDQLRKPRTLGGNVRQWVGEHRLLSAIAGGTLVAGAILTPAIGQEMQRESNASHAQEVFATKQAEQEAYDAAVKKATFNIINDEAVVGSFEIPQNGNVIDPANTIVMNQPEYKNGDRKGSIEGTLLESAKLFGNVQPGDDFVVSRVDVDGDNDAEFVVQKVDKNNIQLPTTQATIPSVKQQE